MGYDGADVRRVQAREPAPTGRADARRSWRNSREEINASKCWSSKLGRKGGGVHMSMCHELSYVKLLLLCLSMGRIYESF